MAAVSDHSGSAGPLALRFPFADHPRFASLAALLCGALTATGFQPLGWWPLALAGLAGLIALGFGAHSARRAAGLGWLFGVSHFSIGNNWIATAFTYQAAMPGWLGWIAVVLLSLFLALYPALAMLGAWAIARHERPGRPPSALAFVLVLAGCWLIAEWLRAVVFTGFAWNPVGMIALGGYDRPGLALASQFLGTYGLSALVILLAGCWWLSWRTASAREPQWITAALLLAVPVALMLFPFAPPGQEGGTLPFRLVQPDIRQEVLNEPQFFEDNFLKTVALTGERAPPGEKRLVLWPESGVPDYLRPGYPDRYYRQTTFAADPRIARQRIAGLMGPGAMLLSGSVDLVIGPENRAVAAENVVTAIAPDGEIAAGYAKSHLVPYGEYLPMRDLLTPLGISRLVPGSIDFRAGPGARTLHLGQWGRAGVQICYEIVFSGDVVDRSDRPDYIVNPSNDGWFGAWGPPQHLAQARMRAIEEGLPVLRPTTTGISAVIDAGGVVRQHVPRHRAAMLEGRVPPALTPTLYARWGVLLSLGWGLLLMAVGAVVMRLRRG